MRIPFYVPDDLMAKTTDVFAHGIPHYFFDIFTPFRHWLFSCTREQFRADVIAGLTVSAVLVPQAMAYAFLVGLPPQMGLYAIIPSVLIASLFGSSAYVITAPVGIVSLLTITALQPFAEVGTAQYIFLASVLAGAVGLVQLALGVFRFGFLARLIPHSVLVGFSSAAALIIISTQIPALLGFSIQQKEHVWQTLVALVGHMSLTHGETALIGILGLVCVLILKKVRASLPAGLLVLLVGIGVSYILSFDERGIAVVGYIPNVLPTIHLAQFALPHMFSLLGSAFIIGLIGFVETFAIGKAVGLEKKQSVSANQELIGQGMANIGSGLFGGLPVSGSFSSTGVNVHAGARTGMSGIVVSCVAVFAALFLTSVLYYIPRALLAAIVIAGALQLVHVSRFAQMFAISRTEGTVAILVFVLSFLFKPDDAVLIGVVCALALFMQRIMWARVAELGFDADWNILRRAYTKDTIHTIPGVLMVRIDMSIFYANVEHVVSQMKELYERKRKEDAHLGSLVMDFSGVNYIDLTALETLGEFLKEVRAEGICVGVIYAHTRERSILKEAIHEVGEIHFLHNIAELRTRAEACAKHDASED